MEGSAMMKMAAVVVLLLAAVGSGYAAETLATKCSQEFQKVTDCLPFVTAKADTPSKACCDSVTEIKDRDPACLCFLIEQIHNGTNSALKSMGIQEARLLQLSSSCKLTNASISECPKLLNLDPKSPDAAIFTNASIATTTPSTSTPASPTTTGGGSSSGILRKPHPILVSVLPAIFAIFFFFHEISASV
ncbi:non-specific lipid transfer protein GPI-anchored 1 [Dorcoceras hygrometricum]|uniref:Non-specific lipid transfer protein GPI-anchored 1 n=1 Tax=Dorcoceras hygrometricum TaxID=472368 RepID=A0A2Z7B4Q5_9LAMI|nr:non-specific lipid transfer protein GPI-anchored 1 [Dorcoceras hygrometricum]